MKNAIVGWASDRELHIEGGWQPRTRTWRYAIYFTVTPIVAVAIEFALTDHTARVTWDYRVVGDYLVPVVHLAQTPRGVRRLLLRAFTEYGKKTAC